MSDSANCRGCCSGIVFGFVISCGFTSRLYSGFFLVAHSGIGRMRGSCASWVCLMPSLVVVNLLLLNFSSSEREPEPSGFCPDSAGAARCSERVVFETAGDALFVMAVGGTALGCRTGCFSV